MVLAVVQPLEYNAFGIKTEWPTLWYAGFVFLAIQLAVCLWFRHILAKPSVRETFSKTIQVKLARLPDAEQAEPPSSDPAPAE